MKHTRTFRAFTIVELIVAMTITVIMLFLINQMFTVTSNAVSLGVSLSDVIGGGRAMSDQIERDTLAMNKPLDVGTTGGDGLMVIVMNKLTTIPYAEPNYREGTRSVGACQIGWLIARQASSTKTGLMPIAPSSDNTLSPPVHSQLANSTAAWVWYGHVQKVNSSGLDNGVLGAGVNRVCNNWTLGRQLTFLVPDAPNTIAQSGGLRHDADVIAITHPGITGVKRYHGLTDIALCALNDPAAAYTLLGGDRSLNQAVSDSQTLYAFSDSATRYPNADYQARALALMYVTQRLRANPLPGLDADGNGTITQAEKDSPFKSGMLAQMHPILTDNVSDFIIEVAGDYADDSALSIDADGQDGTVDTYNVGGQQEIRWYGIEANAATGVAVFPDTMPPWIPSDMNPKLTTIAGGGFALVFRHDFPKAWPYMVRLRYRLHDKRGDLLGDRSPEVENAVDIGGNAPPDSNGKTNVGKWFEQIIHVNRE